jgi:lipopolysaccharide export system permease protein
MKLIQRHYLREFFKLFAILAVGLSLTFSLFGLIQRLDDFMPHSPPVLNLIKYALLRLPQYALSLMPVACLLCSLYTVSKAARSNEIVALMAAGGKVKKLLVPFILTGVLLSLLAFALGEFVVPPASRKVQAVKNEILGEPTLPTLFRKGVLWFRADDGSIVRVKHYLPEQNTYGNVSIFRIGEGGLMEIIEAREAAYITEGNTWKLSGIKKHHMDTGGSSEIDELYYPGLGSPEILKETARKPSEMGVADLYRYLQRLGEAGFKNLRLTVDMHSKVSYPLINLIMVLIGISFPVRRNIKGFVATAIGLVISLVYWFGFSMSLSLGYAGILPPFAAAWLMPVVAGGVGVYLFNKIPE